MYMQVRAIARNIGIPPRKVRLVTEAVKGRRVNEALALLRFIPNAAARPVYKVVQSAAANAENNYNLDADNLYIANIVADPAFMLKRIRARPHGRAGRILRRYSHITVIVTDDIADLPKSARRRRR
jgi:large subunit ribosomal protein L22